MACTSVDLVQCSPVAAGEDGGSVLCASMQLYFGCLPYTEDRLECSAIFVMCTKSAMLQSVPGPST